MKNKLLKQVLHFPRKVRGEAMSAFATVKCKGCNYPIEIACHRQKGYQGIRLEGILTCLRSECGHQWPITIEDDVIAYTQPDLPTLGSERLSPNVPPGLIQDVVEAEKAHSQGCHRASVVMCRRAIQLALEGKGATGRTLGPLLDSARTMTPPLLTTRANMQAEGIKDYGDGGAHRKEEFEAPTVAMVINVTVMVLNELFPK